jgi:YidC/Oxa1 family membrane protein insertase
MPDDNNSRNTIIFVVISLVLLAVYQFFVIGPHQKQEEIARARQQAAAISPQSTVPGAPAGSTTPFIPRADALAQSPRVPVKTPALSGSISLKGGRVDDLYLTNYRETLAKDSPPVELFRPKGAQYAYFARSGWIGANLTGLPGDDTVWTLASGATLTPSTPVTLSYDNGQGLTFTRQIAVDDKYLFTITDTAANHSPTLVSLTPYATVERQGLPAPTATNGTFEGGVGALGLDKPTLKNELWKQWRTDTDKKKTENLDFQSKGGWLGLTDKYWLGALIPDQNETLKADFQLTPVNGVEIFDAGYVGQGRALAPGTQVTETTRLFAGAKVVPQLKAYERSLGVPHLEDAVDWGTGLGSWEYIVAKPMFWLLQQLHGLLGNMGLALLAMTLVVRLIFFYPANLSFASMAKMKKVQPELELIKANFKDDPAGLQRETMALYAENKINPLLGCLPMLATLPVLIGLYKVLSVSIDMRHASFYFLAQDLSARDPSTIWNLFGLIPWHPEAAPLIGTFLNGPLHLGIWAIAYGFTMFLSQSMSPPAGDPTQQQVMKFMPIIFTFFLGSLAVGLLIYYTWSNMLTVLQQYVLMRRHEVDNPIDRALGKVGAGRKKAAG